MPSDFFKNTPEVLNNMPVLKYPELYNDGQIEYFNKLYESTDNISDLLMLADKLKSMRETVFKITSDNVISFNYIVRGIHTKENQADVSSWWDLDPSFLTANEILYLLCYPFWSRMMGSWEVKFALCGKLGKYLEIYKEKIGDNSN